MRNDTIRQSPTLTHTRARANHKNNHSISTKPSSHAPRNYRLRRVVRQRHERPILLRLSLFIHPHQLSLHVLAQRARQTNRLERRLELARVLPAVEAEIRGGIRAEDGGSSLKSVGFTPAVRRRAARRMDARARRGRARDGRGVAAAGEGERHACGVRATREKRRTLRVNSVRFFSF